jgi:hypothetical protein
MTAHRFIVTIDGRVLHGLAFSTEHELEEFLASRSMPRAHATIARPSEVPPEPRLRGRPSFAATIHTAIASVGRALDRCETSTAAARTIQREIARTADPESVPSINTIKRVLAKRLGVQKSAQKSAQKSRRAKLSPC